MYIYLHVPKHTYTILYYTILKDFTAKQSASPKNGLAVIDPICVVVGISQTNTDLATQHGNITPYTGKTVQKQIPIMGCSKK